MQRRRGEEQDNEILNLKINQFRAFSFACITEKIHFDKMSTVNLFGVKIHSFIKRNQLEKLEAAKAA